MKKILALLAFLVLRLSAQTPVVTLPHHIDSAAVPKVIYIDDNFDSLKNALNTVIAIQNADSVLAEIKSIAGLRFTIDDDNNSTAEAFAITRNGAADTAFRCLDLDLNCRFFGRASTDSDFTVGRKLIVTDSVRLTQLAPSLPLFTTANRQLTTNAMTGTGSVVMSASPTLSGTIAGASQTLSGTLDVTGTQMNSNLLRVTRASGSNTAYSSRVTGDAEDRLAIAAAGTLQFGSGALAADANLYRSAADMLKTDDSLTIAGSLAVAGITSTGDVSVSKSAASIVSAISTDNTSGTSHARLQATAGGASGGDAFTRYTVTGVTDWSTGADNSDGDAYVITPSTTPGGATNGLKITTGGAVTIPGTLGVTGVVTADSLVSPKFYEEGTWTATLTGVTTTVTATAYYVRVGKMVTVMIPQLIGTSNTTSSTVTGFPASIQPLHLSDISISRVNDNGNSYAGFISINSGSYGLGFYTAPTTLTQTFTSSGSKGIGTAVSFSYSLN